MAFQICHDVVALVLDPFPVHLSQVLVERMSGVYSKNFHDGVTHLVAGSVVSEKYTVAVGKEIPIMTAQWVEEVSTPRD